jgi:hypothetical protein
VRIGERAEIFKKERASKRDRGGKKNSGEIAATELQHLNGPGTYLNV